MWKSWKMTNEILCHSRVRIRTVPSFLLLHTACMSQSPSQTSISHSPSPTAHTFSLMSTCFESRCPAHFQELLWLSIRSGPWCPVSIVQRVTWDTGAESKAWYWNFSPMFSPCGLGGGWREVDGGRGGERGKAPKAVTFGHYVSTLHSAFQTIPVFNHPVLWQQCQREKKGLLVESSVVLGLVQFLKFLHVPLHLMHRNRLHKSLLLKQISLFSLSPSGH